MYFLQKFMQKFLNISTDGNHIELLIDTNIFAKDIVLKAAFNFLDRGYFFFRLDENKNLILQLTKRTENSENLEKIIEDFSDVLLETYLRDKLEKDNKVIRETIVTKAINGPIDSENFVSFNTEEGYNSSQNEIDFDKDIDEILAEIENDPDLKIDEEEIERILAEIEAESFNEPKKPKLNLDAVQKAKENFKK